MNAYTSQILKTALELPETEREEVAIELLESLAPDGEADHEAAWEAEIQRRIEDLRLGRVQGIPWEEVRRKMRSKL
jgi:putative addiction module component (TIGR02574 family)